MATFGTNPDLSGGAFEWTGLNTDNETATGVLQSQPEAGRVTSLSVHMGGHGSNVTARLVAWDSGGAAAWYTSQFLAGSGRAWRTVGLSVLNAAGSWYLGFWRDPAGSGEWGYQAGVSTYQKKTIVGDVGGIGGASSTVGLIGAYATYTPLRVYKKIGGVWTPVWPYVKRSGSWQSVVVYVKRSGAWQPLSRAIELGDQEDCLVDGEPGLIVLDHSEHRHFGTVDPGRDYAVAA